MTERQKTIVEAAIKLIDEGGIQNVTMKNIAARLDITEPAIYRHFASKNEILLAMLVASAIGNPIRALRRNLPSAMGIFPTRDALTIVVVMQLSRMIGAILLIALTGLFIHYTH